MKPDRATPEEIIARLREAYGPLPQRRKREAMDELVLGVLSQNTSDVNSGRAFERLKAAFPEWHSLLAASVAAIEEVIRPGGLGPTRAARIKALAGEVWERRRSFDLRFLGEMPIEEAKAWLVSLPGVGPKTAAVTLLFSLGRPALPVDTHVHRVARRLGLVDSRASPERTQEALESLVQPGAYYAFHMYLILHGRWTCAARRPQCPSCALRPVCPAAPTFYPGSSAGT